MEPIVQNSFLPIFLVMVVAKGRNRKMPIEEIMPIRPEIWAFLKYAWNRTCTAVWAPYIPMKVDMPASVAPTAARLRTKAPIALKTLNLGASSPARTSVSTRMTVLRIMNWKQHRPMPPMISAIQNIRSPITLFWAS